MAFESPRTGPVLRPSHLRLPADPPAVPEPSTISEFIPAMYLILRGREPMTVGRFDSAQALLGHIGGSLPKGVYRVYRLTSQPLRARPGSSFWGEVTHHGDGDSSN